MLTWAAASKHWMGHSAGDAMWGKERDQGHLWWSGHRIPGIMISLTSGASETWGSLDVHFGHKIAGVQRTVVVHWNQGMWAQPCITACQSSSTGTGSAGAWIRIAMPSLLVCSYCNYLMDNSKANCVHNSLVDNRKQDQKHRLIWPTWTNNPMLGVLMACYPVVANRWAMQINGAVSVQLSLMCLPCSSFARDREQRAVGLKIWILCSTWHVDPAAVAKDANSTHDDSRRQVKRLSSAPYPLEWRICRKEHDHG